MLLMSSGWERINEKVYEMAQEYAEEKAAELEASGITIIEDEEGLTVESVDDSDPSEA